MIQEYKFGLVKIDNKEYDYDVLIRKDEVVDWWREESHRVSKKDLAKALSYNPEFMVIGKGASGMMEVPGSIYSFAAKKRIQLIVGKTKQATLEYNRLEQEGKNVVALLHLTC